MIPRMSAMPSNKFRENSPRLLRVIDQEVTGDGCIRISRPGNRQHEEQTHCRIDFLIEVHFCERDRSPCQIVICSSVCSNDNEHVLLDTEWAWVGVEAPFCKRDLDHESWDESCTPIPHITGCDLDEEYRIRGGCGPVLIYLLKEGSGGDEQEDQQEISEGDCGKRRIIV